MTHWIVRCTRGSFVAYQWYMAVTIDVTGLGKNSGLVSLCGLCARSSVDVKLALPVGRRVWWVSPSAGLSMTCRVDVKRPTMKEGRRRFSFAQLTGW